MSDADRTLRKKKLSDQGRETQLEGTTVEERFAIMWQLAVDAWAFKGEPVTDEPFPLHIVRVVRGKEE